MSADSIEELRCFFPKYLMVEKGLAISLIEDNGPRQGGNNEAPPHTYRMFSHHNFYEQ